MEALRSRSGLDVWLTLAHRADKLPDSMADLHGAYSISSAENFLTPPRLGSPIFRGRKCLSSRWPTERFGAWAMRCLLPNFEVREEFRVAPKA